MGYLFGRPNNKDRSIGPYWGPPMGKHVLLSLYSPQYIPYYNVVVASSFRVLFPYPSIPQYIPYILYIYIYIYITL